MARATNTKLSGLICVLPRTLDAAAQRFGTLAEQTPSPRGPGESSPFQRQLWGVMHRLHPDDREIITMLGQGWSHQRIADELGVCRSAVSERLPSVYARVRWWAERPELPDDDDLRTHLARCPPMQRRSAARLVSYINGETYRAIGDDEGHSHVTILRSVQRAINRVDRSSSGCPTCRLVLCASDHRERYQPPTTPRRMQPIRRRRP